MLFLSGFLTLVRCFSNRNDRKERQNANLTETTKSKNSDNVTELQDRQDFSSNHIDEGQPRSEITEVYINGYGPFLNSNEQQNSNLHPSFQNINDCNSYHNNFTSYDQNLRITYNNNDYFYYKGQLPEHLPSFVALKRKNNDNLLRISCANKKRETNNINQEYPASISNIPTQAANSVCNNKRSNDSNDELASLSEESMIVSEKKKLKTCEQKLEFSENRTASYASNIKDSSENQSFNDESKQETVNSNTNQSFNFIDEFVKKLKKDLIYSNMLKTYEKRFFTYKTNNESFNATFCSELKKLNELSEYTKTICKKLIQKIRFIEDSEENRNIYKQLQRLVLDINNSISFFKRSTEQKKLNSSVGILDEINENFKLKIKAIERSIQNLKKLGIEKLIEVNNGNNLNDNLLDNTEMRDLVFYYQEENSCDIQKFKISMKKRFRLSSFTCFEEFIYICMYSPDRYLKVLKVDLKSKKYIEIDKYVTIDEEKGFKRHYFGFGSRHTIIRSDSEGKLFLLKSLLIPCEKRSVSKVSFELLVIDKDLKKLACIQVDTVNLYDHLVRPAILDLIVHNGLIYALDMKSRCLKILNESLELLRTISIPESLDEIEDTHLIVSSKFVLIGYKTSIYYIKNNGEDTKFNILELNFVILNIAYYNEKYFIIRSINCYYLLKMKENLTKKDFKLCQFPVLAPFENSILSKFMIKDNFVYFISGAKHEIYKLNFILNTSSEVNQ